MLLAACLAGTASAQTYNWTGAGDGTTWSQGANWQQSSAPAPGAYQIFIGTGFPTTSVSPINIGASDVVQLSDTMFGPEWGQTLNVSGSISAGFGFAPVGDMNGTTSFVNLFGNASLATSDSIFIGDMFWFNGGPNVVMNLYNNSQVSTKYLAVGGHLNIYGGTVTVNNALLTGTPTAGAWGSPLSTDSTRLIDVAGGRLVVVGDATAQANDLIARGVLEGNGIVGNVSIDTLSDPGFTVITAVPEPASLALLGLGALAVVLRRRFVS
jgi:hypothetical protein